MFDPTAVYARKHGWCSEADRARPSAPHEPAASELATIARLMPAIQAVADSHRDEIERCHTDAADLWPGVEGSVDVTLVIAPDGTVSQAWVAQNQTGIDELACCVAGQIRTWQMPAHELPSLRVTKGFAFDASSAPPPLEVWPEALPKPEETRVPIL